MAEAEQYFANLKLLPDPKEDATYGQVQQWTLCKHALVVDQALDLMYADMLAKWRNDGSFLGGGFTTDESPPKAARLRGLRFQITHVYIPCIPPVEKWSSFCNAFVIMSNIGRGMLPSCIHSIYNLRRLCSDVALLDHL